MKKLLSAFILILLSICSIGAEVKILSIRTQPGKILVGQKIRVFAVWDDTAIDWTPHEYQFYSENQGETEPTLEKASLVKMGSDPTLVLDVVLWKPGDNTIKNLKISGIDFPPIVIQCSSLLAEQPSFSFSPLPQMEPKELKVLIIMSLAILFIVVLFVIFGVRPLLAKLAKLSEKSRLNKARRKFEKLLLNIAGKPASYKHWTILSECLRDWVSTCLAIPIVAFTPEEIKKSMITQREELHAILVESANILQACDMARFAHSPEKIDEYIIKAQSLPVMLDSLRDVIINKESRIVAV